MRWQNLIKVAWTRRMIGIANINAINEAPTLQPKLPRTGRYDRY
jgi:hypothetical protein